MQSPDSSSLFSLAKSVTLAAAILLSLAGCEAYARFQLDGVLEQIRQGDTEAVKQALERNPALYQVDTDTGASVLFRSLLYEHEELALMAIAGGSNVNLSNSQTVTPIYFVFNRTVAEALVAAGADPMIETFEGTPLHWAAKHDHRDVVEYFLELGLPINALSGRDNTALDLAIERDREDMAELLRAHGGKTSAEL